MTGPHRRMPASLGYTTGICGSGKRSYFSRAGARKVAKDLRQKGEKAVHAYYCDDCNHHHVGHLPFVVRRGIQSQREWRADR